MLSVRPSDTCETQHQRLAGDRDGGRADPLTGLQHAVGAAVALDRHLGQREGDIASIASVVRNVSKGRDTDHALLRNSAASGIRPHATRRPPRLDLALQRGRVDRATRLHKGFGSPEFSQRLPRGRSTSLKKIAICRDEEGERRDSNPRPPGPQPAPTGASQAHPALSGDPSCYQFALTCAHNFPRRLPRAYVAVVVGDQWSVAVETITSSGLPSSRSSTSWHHTSARSPSRSRASAHVLGRVHRQHAALLDQPEQRLRHATRAAADAERHRAGAIPSSRARTCDGHDCCGALDRSYVRASHGVPIATARDRRRRRAPRRCPPGAPPARRGP